MKSALTFKYYKTCQKVSDENQDQNPGWHKAQILSSSIFVFFDE